MGPRRPALALLFLLGPAACKNVTPAGAVFDSQPPGARVLIDGRDSGYATPCQIALDEDEDYDVRLELEGFEPAEVRLRESSVTYVIPWSLAYAHHIDWIFPVPLFLPLEDMLLPWRETESHSPWRVFVHLRPARKG